MNIFKTVQDNFALIGIVPELVTQAYPFNWKVSKPIFTLTMSSTSVSIYIFNEAQSFIEYTQSAFLGASGVHVLFLLLIVILKVEKLFEYLNRCDAIVNTTLKYSASRSIFIAVNQFEEKLSKITFFFMVKLTPASVFVPWCIYIYINYFTTGLGPDAFELPCPMWFPFDWKAPIGFMVAMLMQYVSFLYGLKIGACIFILSIGTYLYSSAQIKCIKGSLFAFNRNAQAENDRSVLLGQLTEFLEFYSSAKQLSEDNPIKSVSCFSDLVQHMITILLVCSLIVMCGAFLLIQNELLHHSDKLTVLLVIVIEVFYAFGVLLVCCELGQRINVSYDECSEIVEQFDWYLFPPEIQRMLPIIINFTQQPTEISCFGSAACDRETFKSIIKTAYSYFTVLRRFYN